MKNTSASVYEQKLVMYYKCFLYSEQIFCRQHTFEQFMFLVSKNGLIVFQGIDQCAVLFGRSVARGWWAKS